MNVYRLQVRRWVFLFLVIVFVWGITMVNYTIINDSHQREAEKLQSEILAMSERYVRLMAKDSESAIDGPYAARLTGYDLKKTLAVLLTTMMDRVSQLEHKVEVLSNATRQVPQLSSLAHQRQQGAQLFLQQQQLQHHDDETELVAVDVGRLITPNNASRQLLVSENSERRDDGEGDEQRGRGDVNNASEDAYKMLRVNAKDLLLGAQEDCSIKSTDKVRFPHCNSKMEWMAAHWKSDPCYAAYGVDGSPCSYRLYLSEVEHWCPLLPGRTVKPQNTTHVEMTTVQLNIRGLMDKLQDPGQRHNYAWMRMRIKRLWPRWTAGAKRLQEQGKLETSVKKKVVIHLGLLTKASGWRFAENSFKGGPLGELVQWSDIISALYILGHEIYITSEVEQLQSHMNKMGKKSESCPSRSPTVVSRPHLLYTDLKGLQQLKRVVKAGIGQYSCMLRIIDSFGTEPAFNYGPYAKQHRLKTAWGMQGLNPLQFYTMFPHSPDNSFMGFVVETHVNDSVVKNLPRMNQALVYGKAENMWQDKGGYLDILHEQLEIHGTVFLEQGSSATLPSYVINHGILSGFDLHKLLRQSKIFIGLGFPYEGPAPLEAIAQGCVYINPKFSTPHSSANTNFFKGKPTLRKLTSQHPYAEDFIGEPHVYTVDISDKDKLRAVISTAIKSVDGGEVTPFMPYEFTEEGMLQRLNAYVRHQDFCNPYTDLWPPEQSVEIILGELGKSCKDVCAQRSLLCEPTHFPRVNNADRVSSLIGHPCDSVSELEDIFFPAYHEQHDRCITQKEVMLFSCVGEHQELRRVCPCRHFIPGQTALCPMCQ